MTVPLDGVLQAEALLAAWQFGGVQLKVPSAEGQRHLDALVAEGLIEAVEGGYVGAGDEAQARKRYAELSGLRACARCHCTEHWACEGGCWWTGPDLCSSCTPESAGGTA